MAIISRQTSKGLIEVDLDDTGNFRARLAGKHISLSIAGIQPVEELLSRPFSRANGEYLQKTGYTHLLGSKVALHADEAVQLEAAAQAAAETNPFQLRSERDRLADEIGCLAEAAHEDRVTAIERASATGVYSKPDDRADAIAAARAALAAFDAAHPEIKAEIVREREASVKRHMWD
jgi:hypothetical protein